MDRAEVPVSRDPWDEDPTAFEEDEADPPSREEVLAQALHRARHPGGSHLFGLWWGLYHGMRAGNEKMRAEA